MQPRRGACSSKRSLAILTVLAIAAGSVAIGSERALADPATDLQGSSEPAVDLSPPDAGGETGGPEVGPDAPMGDDPGSGESPAAESGAGALDSVRARPFKATPDPAVLPRIVGGATVKMSYAPWQVALIALGRFGNDYEGQFCGGSVISREWIVTAAHCVVSAGATMPVSSLRILAGSATLSTSTSNAVEVRGIVVRPGYDDATGFEHDIALVRLSQPLRLKKGSIEAIALPVSEAPAGSEARITGWGLKWMRDPAGDAYNYYGSEPFPTALQGTTVIVQADQTCRDELGSYGFDASFDGSLMLCAKTSSWPRDTCRGDSGGPLAIRVGRAWQLAGVTSWGLGCAWASPGVYTNVANYRSWIETSILLPGAPPSFSEPVRTADGYRFEILDHQPGFRYDVAVASGSGRVKVGRPSGGVLPVTVSRVAPGGSLTARVMTSREGHISHTDTVTANALLAGVRPVASKPVSNGAGFTFQILNHSPDYDYQSRIRSGSDAVEFGTPSGGVLPVTVTGVAPIRSATVVISAVRSGYTTQSVTVKGSASR